MPLKLVIIESPYAGNIRQNRRYARRALRHSLSLDEAPICSHLLYPQVLKDDIEAERKLGIKAGLAWLEAAEFAAFYADLGFSRGMLEALVRYSEAGKRVEVRYINARGRPPKVQGSEPDESGGSYAGPPDPPSTARLNIINPASYQPQSSVPNRRE